MNRLLDPGRSATAMEVDSSAADAPGGTVRCRGHEKRRWGGASKAFARRHVALGQVLLIFLMGFIAAPAAAPQERHQVLDRQRASDWGADNLEMVTASPLQIREVLMKEPGLMMELKRLMAAQATDRGQLISEEDLDDSAILDRLTTDLHFRALATRLLQRYGYLTPQFNPYSLEGQQQMLIMRAKAERVAREEAVAPSGSNSGCGSGNNHWPCSTEASAGMGSGAAWGISGAACGKQGGGPCLPMVGNPLQPENPPQKPGEDSLPPDVGGMQGPNNQLLTAIALGSAGAPGNSDIMSAAFHPTDFSLMSPSSRGLNGLSSLSSNSSSLLGFSGQLGSGGLAGLDGALLADAHAPEPPAPHAVTLSRPTEPPVLPPQAESVAMVKSPSPYAYVPSLYDLYVQAQPRTGTLQRFGLEAFRHLPQNEGMPMDVPAGPDYVLGPGDSVSIDLWGSVSQRLLRTVDREGRLSLPEAGPLLVSGKTLGEVQEVVQRSLRTQFRDVFADVSLTRLRTVRVYVVGEVASPGAYDISALSTPLNALWSAGGVTARGSLRQLRHIRGHQLIEEVDVYDLLLRGVRGDLKNFQDGDTLLVPPVGPLVTIDGMVRRPAIYELQGETNLAQALELAGGMLPAATLRHIEVQRLDAHEKRTMLSLNIDDAADSEGVRRELAGFAVHDGDEVHIFPIAPYNSATVYLQGHVLRPGRYAYTPGMTVADLLSSYHEMLPEPAQHYAEVIRLRQPDWRPVVESFDLAKALAQPSTAPQLQPLDTVRIFGRYDVEAPPVIWLYGEVRSPGAYRTSGQMHLRDAIYEAGGLQPEASLDSVQLFRTVPHGELKVLNVNLAAALDADPLENVLVQPRDRILVHRSIYREDPPSVYIRGEVVNPGRYPLAQNMRLSDLMGSAGGAKRSADLKNGDLTRYRTNSGAVPSGAHERVDLRDIAMAANRNVLLHDGDVVSVPQLPGWNDLGASITVKGEVKNPGVYGVRPGERLSSILKRAGGLLPTAYPEGVIFTRVSVRDLQEKSRLELMQRMQQAAPNIKPAINATNMEAAALAAEAMQQRDRALETLRSAPISGRLVVRMRPGLKGFEHSPDDIEVVNGDSIDIPKEPGFVLVIGQVYNTNAVTYVPGKNAAWYLGQGGGVTRLGDKGAIFIVRADGEVVSHEGNGMWSGNVLSVAVRPGDTLVVPEKPITGGSKLRNLLALTQLAQAAAITGAVLP